MKSELIILQTNREVRATRKLLRKLLNNTKATWIILTLQVTIADRWLPLKLIEDMEEGIPLIWVLDTID